MSNIKTSKIKIVCPCGKKYLVRANLAGKKSRCRNCGKVLQIDPLQEDRRDSDAGMMSNDSSVFGENISIDTSRNSESHDREKRSAAVIFSQSLAIFSQSLGLRSLVILSGIIILVFSQMQTTWDGPTFLTAYMGIGFCIVLACLIARLTSLLTLSGVIIAILAYESIGANRIVYGMTQGMHKFDSLFSMMIFGPFIFLIASFADGQSSTGRNHSCSSCSSCGGGGGCGGGCGGCGGD